MNPHPGHELDFFAILSAMNRHGVEYIVVGGMGAVLQGAPISTWDLDLVQGRDPENVTKLVAALGLSSLVVLMAVSMLASARTTHDIYVQLDELNSHHRRVEESLRRLRSDVNLSGIFVRDYLLDVARERAPEYRQQIAEFRRTNLATLAELKTLIEHDAQIASLESKLDE